MYVCVCVCILQNGKVKINSWLSFYDKIFLGGEHKPIIFSVTRIHWFHTWPIVTQLSQWQVESRAQYHCSKSLFLSEIPEEVFENYDHF